MEVSLTIALLLAGKEEQSCIPPLSRMRLSRQAVN